MQSTDAALGKEQVTGNVSVLTITSPTIRGNIHRSDPDGTSTVPYFSGLSGTSLTVAYGQVGGTPTTTTINFTSNSYSSAIAAIAAADVNLLGVDENGYFAVQTAGSGSKLFLQITGGTAAPVLGLPVDPAPGSYSRSGDLVPAKAGGTTQNNPQTTKLLPHDEELSSQAINRAILGAIEGVNSRLQDLDREFATPQIVAVSGTQAGGTFAASSPGTKRVSLDALLNALAPGNAIVLLDSSHHPVYGGTNGDTLTQISSLSSVSVTAYGGQATPPAVTDANFAKTLKASLTSIYSIQNNVVVASGPVFANAEPHDIVTIQGANNNSPFNHNGEFAIVQVVNSTTAVLRALGPNESLVDATEDKPPRLNPTIITAQSYGSIGVYWGKSIPLSQMVFTLAIPSSYFSGGNFSGYVKLPILSSLREMSNDQMFGNQNPEQNPFLAYINKGNIFALLQTLQKGVSLSGYANPGGSSYTQPARISVPVADSDDDLGLIYESAKATNDIGHQRVWYRRSDYALIITVNANYDKSTGNWTKDVSGQLATRRDISPSGSKFYRQDATDNTTISGDSWPQIPVTVQMPDLSSTTSPPPLLTTPATNALYSQIWESSPGSSFSANGHVRIYLTGAGAFVITCNAKWDGTANWIPDQTVANYYATKLMFAGVGAVFFSAASATSNIPDASGWTTVFTTSYSDALSLFTASLLGTLAFDDGKVFDPRTARIRTNNITSPASDTTLKLTLFWEMLAGTGVSSCRLYGSTQTGGGLFIALNAKWDGSNWNADDSTKAATCLVLSQSGITFCTIQSGSATWADSQWAKIVVDDYIDMPEITTPSAPAASTGRTFFRSNGLSSPNHRTQFCIIWPDGTTTVIAESNPS